MIIGGALWEHENKDVFYELSLFVTGASPNSSRAIANITAICEQYLAGRYHHPIIDIYQEPHLAEREDLLVVPTLIKTSPLPQRKFVGDMSNKVQVLNGLGLK